MEGIRKGEVSVINPFNRVERTIDLRPEAVHSIVFWSKNFGPFLDAGAHSALDRMGYRLFFNFTVNAPNPVLEPNLPGLEVRMDQAKTLCRDFGPDGIAWRFDPVSFYEQDEIPADTLGDFAAIARDMANLGISRCITSFYDPYRKVDLRLKRLAEGGGPTLRFTNPGLARRKAVIEEMAALLAGLNIRLFLCCEKELVGSLAHTPNVGASACIDGPLLKKLFGGTPSLAKDTGQRRQMGCQCTKSVDIGSYDLHPCSHNCLFCYARTGMDLKKKNRTP